MKISGIFPYRSEPGQSTDQYRDPRQPLSYVSAFVLMLLVGANSVAAQDSNNWNSSGNKAQTAQSGALRRAWFGDLHIHTQNSFDTISYGVRATPDDAYRFAKGEPLTHALGYPIRLHSGPLDFLAVADHAEYLGAVPALADPDSALAGHPLAKDIQSEDPNIRLGVLSKIAGFAIENNPVPDLHDPNIALSAWQETIDAAEHHYEPGRFTTFIAYEYTSTPGGANLHRNVIFSGSKVPMEPFSAMDSPNPEDLWTWLDALRSKGIEALAIPHNSFASQGLMFERTNQAGDPIDTAYSEKRIRNEPLVELTQIQGTSETHPLLSPNDEWADFENRIAMDKVVVGEDGKLTLVEGESLPSGYVREAFLIGLEIEKVTGSNPYTFGLIGSTDTHDAAGSVEEFAYFGQVGLIDGSPVGRGSVPSEDGGTDGFFAQLIHSGASGLAGVWAEENTRESIYAAFRRKETFATSGPRIRLRFFAGYDFSPAMLSERDAIAQAYAHGVPMGGSLVAEEGRRPTFFLWAIRDPNEAWLQRLQIIKGWIEEGETKEQVFDVACSDGLVPDPLTNRCPDNGASVNPTDCHPSLGNGATELQEVWSDPTFDSSQRAFYYARVLQNPTCRWSTWDAIRAGVEPSPHVPKTIQERAWSSPISYSPSKD